MRACRTSPPEHCSPSVMLAAPSASYPWLHSVWGVGAQGTLPGFPSLGEKRSIGPTLLPPSESPGGSWPTIQAPEAFLLIYPLMICDQEKPFTELPPSPGVSQEPHQAHPSTFFGAKDRSAIPGSVIFMLETSGMPFDLFVILTIFSGLCLFSRL